MSFGILPVSKASSSTDFAILPLIVASLINWMSSLRCAGVTFASGMSISAVLSNREKSPIIQFAHAVGSPLSCAAASKKSAR